MCGAENDDDARFCESCGEDLRAFFAEEAIFDETERIDTITEETEPEWGNQSEWGEEQEWENQSEWGEEQEWEDQSEWEKQREWEEKERKNRSDSADTLRKPQIDLGKLKAKGNGFTKIQKIVIGEAVLLIALIALFIWTGMSKTSASSVASSYMKAYVSHNWEKMYDLMEYPDGAYLQKEQFVEMSRNSGKDISNFEIREERGSGSKMLKTYTVDYSIKGQGTQQMYLTVVNQGEKSLFFFDTWKVLPEDQIASDFCLEVPKGAEITVDGFLVSEDDKVEEESDYGDVYRITLFQGVHKIQAAVPWCEIYEGEFEAVTQGNYVLEEFKLTEEGERAIQAKMEEALEQIYSAVMEKKDFSEVEDLFMEEYQEECSHRYEYLMNKINSQSSYKLNQVVFKNFSDEAYHLDGVIEAELEYDYNIQYTYTSRSWYSGKTTTELRTDSGTDYMSAEFAYDGETYKIVSISVNSVL